MYFWPEILKIQGIYPRQVLVQLHKSTTSRLDTDYVESSDEDCSEFVNEKQNESIEDPSTSKEFQNCIIINKCNRTKEKSESRVQPNLS